MYLFLLPCLIAMIFALNKWDILSFIIDICLHVLEYKNVWSHFRVINRSLSTFAIMQNLQTNFNKIFRFVLGLR